MQAFCIFYLDLVGRRIYKSLIVCVFFFRFLLHPYIVLSPVVAFLVTDVGLLSHGWGISPLTSPAHVWVLDCVHLFSHVHILNLSFLFFHYWLWKTPSIHSPNRLSSVGFDVLLFSSDYSRLCCIFEPGITYFICTEEEEESS